MKKKIAMALILSGSLIGGPVYSTVTLLQPGIKVPKVEIAYGSTEDEVKKQITDKAKHFKQIEVNQSDLKTDDLGEQKVAVQFASYLGRESQKNLAVQVVDREEPIIHAPKTIEVEAGEEMDIHSIIRVTDNVPKEPKVTIEKFSTDKPGTRKVKVTASDASGNQSEKEIQVEIRDTKAPILTAESFTIEQGQTFSPMTAAKAVDAVDGDLTKKIEVLGQVDVNKVGNYRLTYQVADHSGNQAKLIRNIQVVPAKAVAETHETTTTEKQPVAETNKPQSVGQPANSLLIAGQVIPYQNAGQASGQSVIDANHSMVATWGGNPTQSGDDNQNTHFIGHNPGVFAILFSVGMGETITVTDIQGKATTYVVHSIFQVDDWATGMADGVDYGETIVGSGQQERITLQTCVNDDINLIILADKA